MGVIFALIELAFSAFFIVVTLLIAIVLIILVFTSVVYLGGYICDIVRFFIIGLGHFIGRKFLKIKNYPLVVRGWKKIQVKELYLRYETPLFTYCFSFAAISILAFMLPVDNDVISAIVASILYPLLYFGGMCMTLRHNEQYYDKVLDNNLDFLKLSFLPLGFIITVSGFAFTISGVNMKEFTFDYTVIANAYINIINPNSETNVFMLFLQFAITGLFMVILFYIISLPIQVFSYLIISMIKYFRRYRLGYIGLLKKCHNIISGVLKKMLFR